MNLLLLSMCHSSSMTDKSPFARGSSNSIIFLIVILTSSEYKSPKSSCIENWLRSTLVGIYWYFSYSIILIIFSVYGNAFWISVVWRYSYDIFTIAYLFSTLGTCSKNSFRSWGIEKYIVSATVGWNPNCIIISQRQFRCYVSQCSIYNIIWNICISFYFRHCQILQKLKSLVVRYFQLVTENGEPSQPRTPSRGKLV